MKIDGQQIAENLMIGVKSFVSTKFSLLQNQISLLEEKLSNITSKDGRDGRDGKDGRDGQDAKSPADIDVLSAIDCEKSYAKGTFASHRGGIWIARKNTSGMDGWECIVNGYDSIECILVDEREFQLEISKTSGEILKKNFTIPVLIYRGIYDATKSYCAGDCVTWSGSVWSCKSDTDVGPSGAPEAWQLAVKRGRDANTNKHKGEK